MGLIAKPAMRLFNYDDTQLGGSVHHNFCDRNSFRLNAKPQLRRPHASAIFQSRLRQNNPTGKSMLIFRNRVKCRNQKYSAFAVGQISATSLPVSPDERGVAHVTNARWDAVDA